MARARNGGGRAEKRASEARFRCGADRLPAYTAALNEGCQLSPSCRTYQEHKQLPKTDIKIGIVLADFLLKILFKEHFTIAKFYKINS